MNKDKELEDLMKLASQPPEADEKFYEEINDVIRFCYELGIKLGPTKIKATFIYCNYVIWNRKRYKYKKPISRSWFFREFCKRFGNHRGRDGKGQQYFLDPTPFDLSPELLLTIKKQLTHEKKKK